MKSRRIFGVVLRNLYTFRRNYDRVFDTFYWPAVELIIWGLTSSFIIKIGHAPQFIVMILSGITFWLIVTRSQYETNVSLLEEVWSKNLINLFISPLKFSEWIVATLLIGVIKATITVLFALIFIFFLYNVHLISYGFYLIPFIILLFMTSWWASFLIAGLIFRFGNKVQSFAWMLIFILSPLSAIYYPLSVLPTWAQKVAMIVPTSYVFESLRQLITYGTFNIQNVVISFFLNVFYLILTMLFIKRNYDKLLERGLLKVF